MKVEYWPFLSRRPVKLRGPAGLGAGAVWAWVWEMRRMRAVAALRRREEEGVEAMM